MLLVIMMMWAFVAMTAAQLPCDPVTQYKEGDECCKKCGPGTSRAVDSTCHYPRCQKCGEKEYQDSYTTEDKCERQPYCDPNTNFEAVGQASKTKKTECTCKLGFHCSSVDCLTCVAHTECEPGQWARSKGDQKSDTVCEKCPNGTFSTERSWDSVCKKWTECGSGYHIKQNGTAVSDNVCEENSRQHLVVIGVVVPLIGLLVAVGAVVFLCREPAKGKVKGCVESCMGGEGELLRDGPVTPNQTVDYTPVESKEPIQQISQDDSRSSLTPEENEDEHSQESFKPVRLSEKGNYVVQENGKLYPLPRQESQTLTRL